MNTIDRNVVITFDQTLEEEFIRLSRAISETVNSKIVLNEESEIPHMTLYMSKYPAENEELLFDEVEKIAEKFKPFSLTFNSKTCYSSGTIFVNTDNSGALNKLHSELVDALNPLREGLFNEDELLLPGTTEQKKKSLEEFGMWGVKDLYEPHVSVGRVADLNDGQRALSVLPEKIMYEVQIKTVSVVIRGHDGTCSKLLKTFNLRGQ